LLLLATVLPTRFRDRVTLRPREVAAITGLSVKTVNDLMNQGVLRRIKVGGSVLVLVEDVEEMLSGERCGASRSAPLKPRVAIAIRSLRDKLGPG
jgi:excisionase family DNA binding protein